jgi:hypothetical protein
LAPKEFPDDLLRSFGELSKLLLSNETVGTTLDAIAHLAVQTVPGCDAASVSLVKGKNISTLGSSDEVATALDAIQYETGQGPCLDAIGKDAAWFQLDSMHEDKLWPAFSERATDKGFESLLAFTLKVDDDTLGALNLYARRPSAFDEKDRETGAIYAAHAAIALTNAQTHEKDARLRKELDEALSVQHVIGQAQGILMEREFHTADEALEILRARAQDVKERIGATAQQIIESSEREKGELKLPEGFEDRVLRGVLAERSRRRQSSTPLLIAALTLVGALLIGLVVMALQLTDVRQDAEARSGALRAVLTDKGSAIELSGASGVTARLVAAERGSVFVLIGLPEAPGEQTYQLWLLRSGEIVESRTFEVTDGIALLEVSQETTSIGEVEVTLEPQGGSKAPTTDPLLMSQ